MSPQCKQLERRSRAKALDLWQAPDEAGEPLICLATSFTFDAVFFETECVGRFLQMNTHPQEDEAVSYLIEREEKLASARVCVMVDRRYAQAKESLRWDILPVLVPGGVLHAKVSVLCWANFVRVILASGNLTEPGYRKNLEVFASLEASRQGGGAIDEILASIGFLEEVAGRALGDEGRRGPKQRAKEALAALRGRIRHWPRATGRRSKVVPIFNGTGRPVLEQLRDVLPGGPPRYVDVISPFFDHNDKSADVVSALLGVMAKRRPRIVGFYVPFEESPDNRTRMFAPRALIDAASKTCDVIVDKISHAQDRELRPLHAKILVLANDDWELWMIGSSNFTSAGYGLNPSAANLEANLAYLVRYDDSYSRMMWRSLPELDGEVDLASEDILWEPAFDGEGEGGASQVVALPAAFREALFDTASAPPRLVLSLGERLPAWWRITFSGTEEIFNSDQWNKQEGELAICWEGRAVPLILGVKWESANGECSADWPVNVVEPAGLPLPDRLRNLSLEELIEILGSTRPLHTAVAHALNRRARLAPADIQVDPHKRVNTHEFLLRRTKRVAIALERMRERLERPVMSLDALDWRLGGPVGPLALARSFGREARTTDEARFFLAELGLALGRVKAERAAEGGLPMDKIRERLRASICEAERIAMLVATSSSPAIDRYVAEAFEEAKK